MSVVTIDRLLLQIDVMHRQATQGLTEVDDMLKTIDKDIKKASKSAEQFDMKMLGLGLTLLFSGMALKRFGQQAINTLSTTFMQFADAQNAAVKEIMSLQAAMIYLKFTIFETFAQSDLFVGFINFIVNAAVWLGELVQTNPAVAELLFLFFGLSVVLGSVSMFFGQIALLAFGLGVPFFVLLGIIVIVVIAISALFFIWQEKTHPVIKLLGTLVILLSSIALIALLFGFTLTLFGAIFFGVIIVVITAIILLSKRVGGIGNAFLAVGIFILRILATVADAIVELLVAPINHVIWVLNLAIKAANALGANLSEIPEIGEGTFGAGLGAKVDGMRDRLIAKGDEKRAAQEEEAGNTSPLELGQNSMAGISDAIRQGFSDAMQENSSLLPSTDE